MHYQKNDSYNDTVVVHDFREEYHICKKSESLSPNIIKKFRSIIYSYFKKYKRDFSWRHTSDPYEILVSEIMLQQTQTERVQEKFPLFIKTFPTIVSLADASLKEVLSAWQGLGYNRRAAMLHQLAGQVFHEYSGIIPQDPDLLIKLPGIGKATAASISAFAFNKPTVFIETNIRTVYIHFFFHDRDKITDKDLYLFVKETLDKKKPRDWYSALMDYGAMLKKRYPNPSRKSIHHQKQSRFEGSQRQMRGMILKLLLEHQELSVEKICSLTEKSEDIVSQAIDSLVADGMIKVNKGKFFI